jgi:phosphoribosylformylglycinamidine synthase
LSPHKENRDATLGAVAEIAELRKALPILLAQLGVALQKQALPEHVTAPSGPKLRADSDASVLQFQESGIEKLLCLVVVGITDLDLDNMPRAGLAVAEAARRLACCGSQILGASISLTMHNAGSETARLDKVLGDVASFCSVFNAPVMSNSACVQNAEGGSNESLSLAVAMLGATPPVEAIPSQKFKEEGDVIVLFGEPRDINDPFEGLGASAYLERVLGINNGGTPPPLNAASERELQLALRALIYSGEINSAHSVGLGGLAVALAKCCLLSGLGAQIDLGQLFGPADNPTGEKVTGTPPNVRLDALLFAETPGRVVITTRPENAVKVLARARLLGVPALRLGTVGGAALEMKNAGTTVVWPLTELAGRQD